MTRSAALLLLAGTAAGIVVGLATDAHGGTVTGALLLATGTVALAAAHVAVARRSRLGALSRQFALAVAIAMGQVLVVAALLALLMFVSNDDVVFTVATVAFAGVVAIRAAQLFAGGVLGDVQRLRDGLAAVGAGNRVGDMVSGGRDELAELTTEANAMVRRLAEEEEARDATEGARRNLVAAVSHDLRTPITSLQLLAEAIEDDIVDEEQRGEYIARMRTHVGALGALIDDLFELSRLEAGDIQWSLEQVSVAELVAETVDAMRPHAEAKRVAVLAELDHDLVAAHANPERIQRVLFNLIQNAIRHTPADGSVTVRAERGDGAVEVEVTDTGDGIAATERDLVFEPFARGGADASRPSGGAGLGLAISRAIVEAHGGRIWLEAAPVGTRVRFSLPATA